MVDGADLYSYLIIYGIFVRDVAETPKLEVFAPPPPPLQGKGHSGECNSLLHVKQADEWPARAAEWKGYLGVRPRAREKGGGAFRASRASIIPSPFSQAFISFQTPVTRAGSRRVTVQDAVSYCTAKFLNLQTKIPESCIQRTSTNSACVKKRKRRLERKILIFFTQLSFPLLSAWPWVRAIQASLYLYKQAYKLSIPFGPVFRKACVHCLDNGFRKHLFSEQWLI